MVEHDAVPYSIRNQGWLILSLLRITLHRDRTPAFNDVFLPLTPATLMAPLLSLRI